MKYAYPRRRAFAWSATATVVVCLVCTPRIPVMAQVSAGRPSADDAKRSEEYSATASIGLFLLGSTLSVYTHEAGHWLIGNVAGATHARIGLFPPKTQMQFRLDASTFQKTIPVLAGPLTTRLLAEGVDHYLNATSSSRTVEAIGGATYLAMRFDLPWQVVTSIAWRSTHATVNGHDDIAQGLVLPHFATRRSQNLVCAALVTAEILDIWRDAGEIADNFARLRGRPRRRHGTDAAGLHPLFDPFSGSVGLAFRRHF